MQQATADQAFTNAKAARDVVGMTAALVYRALERNTGSVGQASVPCVKIKAVNPEIASIAQVSCLFVTVSYGRGARADFDVFVDVAPRSCFA